MNIKELKFFIKMMGDKGEPTGIPEALVEQCRNFDMDAQDADPEQFLNDVKSQISNDKFLSKAIKKALK